MLFLAVKRIGMFEKTVKLLFAGARIARPPVGMCHNSFIVSFFENTVCKSKERVI